MILPFAVLLGAMALGPMLADKWWRRHCPKVCFGLAAFVVVYYLACLRDASSVILRAKDYISFIAVVGSLFIVSGGIHVRVKGEATPMVNTVFLACGALLANALGATGASMLMIRPWIRMNRYRITGHHIAFFIFIVSNVGGFLTPVGPPLLMGYLIGVPFWWVAAHGWRAWITGLGLLLAIFYALDARNYHRAPEATRKAETAGEEWQFEGMGNLIFLAIIFGAIFLQRPFLAREVLMACAAAGSYLTTSKPVHEANHFSFYPVKEVAILFIGIFGTIIPALDWLAANASRFQTATPAAFYFGSGMLSSALDNAPTYLSFLSALCGRADISNLHRLNELIENNAKSLLAISVGSVYFGAATYIGNGPNLMVKSIADHLKAPTPSFFGYLFKYALPYLFPMLLLIWWLFFRS